VRSWKVQQIGQLELNVVNKLLSEEAVPQSICFFLTTKPFFLIDCDNFTSEVSDPFP